MKASPIVVGVLIGIVVGFPGGMLFAAARRSWTDFFVARKAIPVVRKTALLRTREALILGLLLAIAGAVAIGVARAR
jgi:hypothetical protein